MALFFRRWRWRHLISAWVGYWAVLAFVTLRDPVRILWRLNDLPNERGIISAEVTNTMISLRMSEDGTMLWAGSASLVTLVLWIAGPPLLLWLAWAIGRPCAKSAFTGRASLGPRTEIEPDRAAIGEGGMSFADQLREQPPQGEKMGIPRDRNAL